jgi:2-iminobutanoate/2-iminopropanoate deaminase
MAGETVMKKLTDAELLKQLNLHQEWMESLSESDRQLWLADTDLSGVDLSARNLAQALLPGVKLENVCLRKTDLYSANLASASLSGADLTQADVTKANLDYAFLVKSILREVKAFQASFFEADLRGVNLADADLRGTYLVGANLEGAILRRARLDGATLDGVRLFRADLRGASGLDTVMAKWIDVGPEGAPIRLEGDQVRTWLIRAGEGKEPSDER